MSDNPPALESRSLNKTLSERVSAALGARAAFIEVDDSARLRRALLKKIRVQTQVYRQGDKMYFKRGADNKWHGPGTVIGIDGKVIFVKHGRLYITASPTRLIKANEVFMKMGPEIDKLGPNIEQKSDCNKVDKQKAKPSSNEVSARVVDSESTDDESTQVIQTDSQRNNMAAHEVGQNRLLEEVREPAEVNRSIQNRQLEEVREQAEVDRSIQNRSNQRKAKYPKENDRIECLLGDEEDARWCSVTVGKKGGESTGKNKSYVNVKYDDNSEGGIHLDKVPWRYQLTTYPTPSRTSDVNVGHTSESNDTSSEENEEVYVVTIPRHLHKTTAVIEAKKKELENFKSCWVFKIVKDIHVTHVKTNPFSRLKWRNTSLGCIRMVATDFLLTNTNLKTLE